MRIESQQSMERLSNARPLLRKLYDPNDQRTIEFHRKKRIQIRQH
ncbi:hypothetical protein RRSWK_01274 [Rhodopirellula sp. SWK7]|nr:hypothetical protein RRSWK_01274 [Rhodopirellula sp. SWK7]